MFQALNLISFNIAVWERLLICYYFLATSASCCSIYMVIFNSHQNLRWRSQGGDAFDVGDDDDRGGVGIYFLFNFQWAPKCRRTIGSPTNNE